MLYMDRRRALIKAIHMQMGDVLEVIGAEQEGIPWHCCRWRQ